MKDYCLLLLICLLGAWRPLAAQVLVANGGQSLEVPNLYLSFSVGEPVVGTVYVDLSTGEEINWFQGFQQPQPPSAPLPLTWLAFSGEVLQSTHHRLRWTVLHDGLNGQFTVERSPDGIRFTALEVLPGQGESGQETAYTYDDYLSQAGSWYYRIRQQDFDGYHNYSSIIRLGAGNEFLAFQAFPNPARHQLHLQWDHPGAVTSHVQVFAPDGRLFRELSLDASGSQSFDISNWPSGTYTLRWLAGADSGWERIIKH